MHFTIYDIGSVLAALFTGGCAFLYCVNRILVLWRDCLPKTAGIVLLSLLLTAGSAWVVLQIPPMSRTPVLGAGLLAVVAAEARHQYLRRRHAGVQPVDTIPHPFQLQQPMTTTDIVTHRYRIRIPKWQGPPLRIAHLSDLHVSDELPASYFRSVLEEATQAKPDLVFITGDFVTEAHALPVLAGLLKPFGRFGDFAVLGNHDYWSDVAGVRRVVSASGIRLLHDESIPLEAGGHKLVISGVDHPWHGGACHIAGADADTLHLVLSHTPDNIYRLNALRADCVFSGHIHAGQFRIPWFGPFVAPSLYGRRFDHGHFIVKGTHLFVVSGVGAACPPFRIYCQPDIFIVEIEGGTPSVA